MGRWTDRYRGHETALLVADGQALEVPILRVTGSLVIVDAAGEEMRYAADNRSGRGFMAQLRAKNGAVVHGPCPMLALEGDPIVGFVREEAAERKRLLLEERALRRRLDPLYSKADVKALRRVALALEEPRTKVDLEVERSR